MCGSADGVFCCQSDINVLNTENGDASMRKISLIIAVAAALMSAPVMAQNATYACQYIDAGGLEWIKGGWKTIKFHIPSPFF